jgi:hypothetical protein
MNCYWRKYLHHLFNNKKRQALELARRGQYEITIYIRKNLVQLLVLWVFFFYVFPSLWNVTNCRQCEIFTIGN